MALTREPDTRIQIYLSANDAIDKVKEIALSRSADTLFHSQDFNSQTALGKQIKKFIADFNNTINSSKFSREENLNFKIAINLLKDVLTSIDTIEHKCRKAVIITVGALILGMAHTDDRYGPQTKFGSKLLFPSHTILEIEKIANIQRFQDPLDQQILAVGEKVLSKEINTIDMYPVLSLESNKNLLESQYLLEPTEKPTPKLV